METLLSGDQTEKIGNPEPLPDNDTEPNDTTSSNATIGGQAESSSKTAAAPASTNGIMSNMSIGTDLNVSLQDHLTHPIASLSPYQNKYVIFYKLYLDLRLLVFV